MKKIARFYELVRDAQRTIREGAEDKRLTPEARESLKWAAQEIMGTYARMDAQYGEGWME